MFFRKKEKVDEVPVSIVHQEVVMDAYGESTDGYDAYIFSDGTVRVENPNNPDDFFEYETEKDYREVWEVLRVDY